MVSVGQESGKVSARQFWFGISHVDAIKQWLELKQ